MSKYIITTFWTKKGWGFIHNLIKRIPKQHNTTHRRMLALSDRQNYIGGIHLVKVLTITNCVSVNQACFPARSAIITGKYSHQIGMLAISGDLSTQHPTYFQTLQKNNYWTAGISKFHWL